MDLMVMARDPRSSPYLASISDLDRLLCLHELPYPNFWSRMRGAAKSNMGEQGGGGEVTESGTKRVRLNNDPRSQGSIFVVLNAPCLKSDDRFVFVLENYSFLLERHTYKTIVYFLSHHLTTQKAKRIWRQRLTRNL